MMSLNVQENSRRIQNGGRRIGGVENGQMYDQDERETFHTLLFSDYMILLPIQIFLKENYLSFLLAGIQCIHAK